MLELFSIHIEKHRVDLTVGDSPGEMDPQKTMGAQTVLLRVSDVTQLPQG